MGASFLDLDRLCVEVLRNAVVYLIFVPSPAQARR
jgi:hypothetical protein